MVTDEILDAMDEILDKALSLPIGNNCVIDGKKMTDFIAQLRSEMPQEFMSARNIVANRNEVLENAKRDAEMIIKVAEEKAKRMVMESEIVHVAQEKANEMLNTARAKDKELRSSTNEYVETILKTVDETLMSAVADIRQTKKNYRGYIAKQGTIEK